MNEIVCTREAEDEGTAEVKWVKTKASLWSEVGLKISTNTLEICILPPDRGEICVSTCAVWKLLVFIYTILSLSMYLLDEFAYLSYPLLLESQCMYFNINC